ncbi:MAG: hypothetical protein LKJ76_10415 [Lachnospiraceae bacterium]|jgi:hypothetical protein|nr:hypothetical protein [Lachnospiraceae bacterium]
MKNRKQMTYMDSVNHYGRIWCVIMTALLLFVPVLMCLIFHTRPDAKGLALGLLATAPMYWAVGIIEVFTYYPMLGAGGSYLSFITGNISNLKLPCALNSLEQAGCQADSEEGEVISTISIAVSSIVTTVIIIIGVILIVPLTPLLQSKLLAPAFAQMIPALFGGLGIAFISKNVKLSILPLILMTVLFITVPALNAGTVGIMVPVGVLLTLLEARIMYKTGFLYGKNNEQSR